MESREIEVQETAGPTADMQSPSSADTASTAPLGAQLDETHPCLERLGESHADTVLESYPLHLSAVRLWAWQHAFFMVIALVPTTVLASAVLGKWAFATSVLLAILFWSIGARYRRTAAARFRCARYARGLLYAHGVWWHSEVFIPSARVQHTEVNQGPIARRYGIGTLKVFSAAVQLGAISIDGLAYGDAVLLRDRLLDRADSPQVLAHATSTHAVIDAMGETGAKSVASRADSVEPSDLDESPRRGDVHS